MLDRDRILAKIDDLDGYLRELGQVVPRSFQEYMDKLEKRRSCERLLQITIQCMLDICHLFVSGFRLGLPAEEDDLFEKLENAGLLSPNVIRTLRTMKGFRNILVHEYGGIDNALVFKAATTRIQDFEAFRGEVLEIIQKEGEAPA